MKYWRVKHNKSLCYSALHAQFIETNSWWFCLNVTVKAVLTDSLCFLEVTPVNPQVRFHCSQR